MLGFSCPGFNADTALLAGLMVRAEQTAATSAEIFNQTSPYSAEAENWLALTEYSIAPHAELEGQFQIPKVLQKHFLPNCWKPQKFSTSPFWGYEHPGTV